LFLTVVDTGAGFFHIAVTAPDVDETLKRAIAEGGKQVGETVPMGPTEKALYLSDPWGNVVEVLGCSYEALMANAG
jgi:predicted enzyme related to lactoylglutathione lyase